jgi:hypothetical protein
MPKHRRNLFERDAAASSGRLAIQLAPLDLAMLKDVSDYRLMNSAQIGYLHHRGLRNFQRRLADLFREGYLERPVQQMSHDLTTGHMVYALGRRGVEMLYEGAERREKLHQVNIDKATTQPHIAHTLMISQFRALVNLAFEDKRHGISLTAWEDAHELKKILAPKYDRAELVPDGFFSLACPKGTLNFFLEADRASEWKERFLDKMKIYRKWFNMGWCEDKLGFVKFQVLTITEDERRKEILRQITKQASADGKGSLMFLFACEKSFSLAEPESLLAPAWLSPKDDAQRYLVP